MVFRLSQKSVRILCVSLIVIFAIYGFIFALATHDRGLSMGDNSTFYTFAHNISQGEAIYKDFIHFRTPGSYFFDALVMKFAGDSQGSLGLALSLEASLLYPIAFLVATAIMFWHSKWLLYITVSAAGMLAFFPPVIQLRGGVALLAIAIYIRMRYIKKAPAERTLLVAGIMTGLTFIFGQETALMVAVTIASAEATQKRSTLRQYVQYIQYFVGGALLGVAPLFLYILVWSNLASFIYYVSYYALVLQPKSMDLPFPELSRANIEYYLPFVIYLFAYLIAYVSKWKYRYIGGIFLSFAILRLVTLLGRSDWGHLLFALPEMLIVVAAALICIRESTFSRVALKAFLPYGSAVAILFLLAINSSSAFLAFVPFVILWSLSSNRKKIPLGKQSYFMPGIILTVFLICVTLMAYTTKDYFMSTAKMLSEELTVDESKSPRIGGMKVDPVTLKEIQDVKNVVEPLKPNTIFSFPIQPFYYSLADHHATRFMTYEPQTTVDEQLISIEELRKNKPQVVIFDPLQAQGLSGSLWMISNYITTNYERVATVKSTNILWIMVPKKSPFYEEKIVFGLKHYISTNDQLPLSVQNDSMGLQNAIMLNKSIDLTIDIKDKNVTALKLSLVKPADVQQELNDCGDIVVGKDRASIKKTICQSDGVVTIPIRHDEENLKITLLNSNTKMTIWNDITLR